MADQAFSNAGLSMFGQDAAIAKQMSTPDSFQEKMAKAASASAGGGGGGANPLAMLANKAFESLANAFPDASKQISGIQGAIMPTGQASPVAPVSAASPVAPTFGVPPATAPTPTGTPQATTGGYRSFFNVPSFGTNP